MTNNAQSNNQGKLFNLNGYEIEINNSTQHEVIKSNWKNLEKNVSVPFFLSWSWISTWIRTYSPELIIVSARYDNQIVALGLFTESVEVRHKVIYSRQLRLHQLGDEARDQIWIEYNDFICAKGHQSKAVNACLQVLHYNEFQWDEIVISMMLKSRINELTALFPLTRMGSESIPGYITDLNNVRNKKKTYLQTLSSNTRHQVRRSIRSYEEIFGPLSMVFANNCEAALCYFQEAGKYHIQKWHDSGFKNPEFTQFHRNLIENSFDSGSIQLCRLQAGGKTIAILYHLIVARKVYFYLQGLVYHSNKKLKPGLVAHVLATESYLQSGMESYDYMGGYSQYKTQLADHSEDFCTIAIQRPRSRFKLENIARKIKSSIMSATS